MTNIEDLQKLEEEAIARGTKYVTNLLQRPGQLEKIDMYKRRISRKKASVETMLKTAMQSQLDGVRVGFEQLQSSLESISVVKDDLDHVNQLFSSVLKLSSRLQAVQLIFTTSIILFNPRMFPVRINFFASYHYFAWFKGK